MIFVALPADRIKRIVWDNQANVCQRYDTMDVAGDMHGNRCIVKCALYENVDKTGQVADWTKI